MVDKIFWNFYAFCYDALLKFNPYQEMIQRIVKELDPKPREKILDAGCGTGNLEVLISKQCPNTSITALDFSEEMLKRAVKKNKGGEISFRQSNLDNCIPLNKDCFDKIICINSLYNLQHPKNALKELARVLKNDGVIILVTPRKGSSPTMILKSHRHKNDSDENWKASNFLGWIFLVFKAFGFTPTAIKFIVVAIFNKKLFETMKVFEENELMAALKEVGLTVLCNELVYGDQCLFIKAQKGGNDGK